MPQHPTLSLSNFLNSAASSSRKRSHAEITRSQSRSTSPPLPSKRRRISPSMDSSSIPFSPSPTPHSAATRFHGDGYGYRSPVMSTGQIRASQGRADAAIDLTLDSDTSTESDDSPMPSQRQPTRLESQPEGRGRAPPFVRLSPEESHEVIDLSDDSDFQIEEFHPVANRTPTPFEPPSSPEIQIVHERPAPQGNRRPSPTRPPHRQPSPHHMDRGPFGYFPDIIRRSTQFMFGNVGSAFQAMQPDLNQMNGRRTNEQRHRQPRVNENLLEDFVINLDYRQPGFTLGDLDMFERSSETPQVVQEPYKAPPPPKEGFIRTFKEDSVVLCPMCGDELASGGDETKQQVWVVKGCGHVYCGECATNRHVTKANKKDKKPLKSAPFKTCAVEGCQIKVSSKTAMFPIYL